MGLAGCSSSMDRFADYPNIATNSVSQTQQRSVGDTGVQSGPLDNAPVAAKPAWQGYQQQVNAPPAPPQPVRTPAAAPVARPQLSNPTGAHEVRSGETLFSIARAYKVSPFDLAAANELPRDYTVRTGEMLKIPGNAAGARAAAKVDTPAPAPKPAAIAETDAPAKAQAPGSAEAAKPPEENRQVSLAEEEAQGAQPAEPPAGTADPADTATEGFRWPVRGKIISSFGQQANGQKNEGINIAVPEGASVRAAEDGVVAYAGSELKGYGNLVLIRHQNGWVTAYAHNAELMVKRGDPVKRGDVIARAGQTGNVTSPQVHFEIRKGATAVDPVKYLTSATAAN
jgi:murein DD-endopeptidase MepM/ murein hydrolase activator NlpD